MSSLKFAPESLVSGAPESPVRNCDRHGCDDAGLYRAPRARDALDTYFWFCLNHVRAYNKAWNFYAGMTAEEVERFVREDVVGWRPTWPVGVWSALARARTNATFHDSFGVFGSAHHPGAKDPSAGFGHPYPPGSPARNALTVMDLEPPLTLIRLKARYKELVKRHHPDANGGDTSDEETLKLINEAYRILRTELGA